MLNFIWLGLLLAAVVIGGATARLNLVAAGAVQGAQNAVTLAFGLAGIMAVWLGMMRLAERSGLVQTIAAASRPVLRWLFPDVPAHHPAIGSMTMNIAANMLGLTNAATPLGLRAMRDLERLNPHPGTATNAMCTFLVINTGSVQLIPVTVIAILATHGSANPYAIVGSCLLATACAGAAGLAAVKLFERLRLFNGPIVSRPAENAGPFEAPPAGREIPLAPASLVPLSVPRRIVLVVCLLAAALAVIAAAWPELFGGALSETASRNGWVRLVNALSTAAIPFLLGFFPLYGALKGLPVYEEFVEGAREGFAVAVQIIPYLAAMLIAIAMFRGAGGLDLLTRAFQPVLSWLQFPPELLPMALMRPLSGSGSLALFSSLVEQLGPDHLVTRMAGTIYGSSETTFYVAAVYFGAVAIQRTRHAIPAGLVADAAGVAASIVICRWLF